MVLSSRRHSNTSKTATSSAHFKRQISSPVMPTMFISSAPSNRTTADPCNCSSAAEINVGRGKSTPDHGLEAELRPTRPAIVSLDVQSSVSAVTTDDDSRPSSPDSAIWTDMSSPDLAFVRLTDDAQITTPMSARAQMLRDVFSPPLLPRTPTPGNSRRRRTYGGSERGPHHRSNPNIHHIESPTKSPATSSVSRKRGVSTSAMSQNTLPRVNSCHQLKRQGTSSEVHFQCWLARQPHTWC